jgi:CxxC-x17-CxxC domain-containing protein
MHPAVCAECGKDTEVPFRPTGERPVYCSDCYRQQSPRGGSGGGGRSYRF